MVRLAIVLFVLLVTTSAAEAKDEGRVLPPPSGTGHIGADGKIQSRIPPSTEHLLGGIDDFPVASSAVSAPVVPADDGWWVHDAQGGMVGEVHHDISRYIFGFAGDVP